MRSRMDSWGAKERIHRFLLLLLCGDLKGPNWDNLGKKEATFYHQHNCLLNLGGGDPHFSTRQIGRHPAAATLGHLTNIPARDFILLSLSLPPWESSLRPLDKDIKPNIFLTQSQLNNNTIVNSISKRATTISPHRWMNSIWLRSHWVMWQLFPHMI